MYQITPIDDSLPSPNELLFGRQPRSLLPNSDIALQSRHPATEAHQMANQHRRKKQAESYNVQASKEKDTLKDGEKVYVRNTLKKMGIGKHTYSPKRHPRT